MGAQQYFSPHIWSYLRRVVLKRLKSPSLAAAVTALNTYKPGGFGVTVNGQAELRQTKTGFQVVHVSLECEGITHDVVLNIQEVTLFLTSSDVRNFVPSISAWTLQPKQSQALHQSAAQA